MFGFLLVINIIVCILLVIVILMQSSKGGGLAGSFGGGNMGAVFGVRRTADFLSKITTILAIVFVVLTLMINFFFLPGRTSGGSVIQSGSQEQLPAYPQAPGQQQQSAPAAQPQQQQSAPAAQPQGK
jgi:preprotein translocase subunit SecG